MTSKNRSHCFSFKNYNVNHSKIPIITIEIGPNDCESDEDDDGHQ